MGTEQRNVVDGVDCMVYNTTLDFTWSVAKESGVIREASALNRLSA